MAFSVQGEDGVIQLYVQELATGVARPLPGTESAAYPFWAPDSRWLAFFTDVDQTLKKIDTAGGPPVTVINAENGKGGSWNQDGMILFAPRADTNIAMVSAEGGELEWVTDRDPEIHNSHRHPRFFPDGQHFIYLARSGNMEESALMLGDLDGSPPKEIVRSPTQGDIAAGHLLFTRGDTLMSQPFDMGRFEVTGTATPLVDEVLTVSGAALGIFSASDSGLLAYNTGELDPQVSLEWRDREGTLLSTLGDPAILGPLTLSPDGKMVISVIFSSTGIGELWVTDVDSGLRSRLTFDDMANFGMDWQADSGVFFFSAQTGNQFSVFRTTPGGGGEIELLYRQDSDLILCSVSPNGKDMLYWQNLPDTNRDLLVRTVGEEGDPRVFRQTQADERCGAFSPDGRWIAYSSNDSGRYEVYVAPYPGPGRRWQVSQEGGLFPQWRSDGQEIVFTRQSGQIMAAEVGMGADTLQIGAVQPLFRINPPRADGTSFALGPDGETLLVWTNRQLHATTVINLFDNWPATLE
jgi:Tol biopolymer transport system component